MELTSFEQRQRKLADQMIPGSLAIIPAASLVTKSNDTEYPFRQDSNFKYFMGSYEPDATFIIKKELDESMRAILFLRDKDEFAEMWTGIRMGVDKAHEILPINEAYNIDSFPTILTELMKNTHKLYYDLCNVSVHTNVMNSFRELQSLRKQKIYRPQGMQDIAPLIGSLRLIKDQNEVLAMKKAAELTNLGFRAAMSYAGPDKNEKDLERLLTHIFTMESGEGHAYDAIVAGGTNALVLHYIENNKNLKDGDWLLVDAGSQVNLYASDVTRTFPINGKFTPAQKDLYQIVLEAQKAGFTKASPGHTITEIHHETSRVLVQAMIDAKILEGSVDGILESGAHRAYYPHGTSHWLGLDVHDSSPYQDDQLNDVSFKEGMSFTIEPGLYFKSDDPKIPEHWRGLGIRTEDDVLITANGHDNLTRAIPKEIKDIEEACKVPFSEFLAKLY